MMTYEIGSCSSKSKEIKMKEVIEDNESSSDEEKLDMKIKLSGLQTESSSNTLDILRAFVEEFCLVMRRVVIVPITKHKRSRLSIDAAMFTLDGNGTYPIEAAIVKNDIDRVNQLVKKCPMLCVTVDGNGKYPIETAIRWKRPEIMDLLIKTWSSCIYDAASCDKLLSLALQEQSWECFRLLCKTYHRRNDHHLLDMKACLESGETYRDIAFQHRILEPCDKDGRSTRSTNEISEENSTGNWSEKRLPLLITVMVFTAGGVFAIPLSFRDVFPISDAEQVNTVNLSFGELFIFPHAATKDFLFFTTATITFMTSMTVIMSAVCSILSKWAWKTSINILSLVAIGAFSLIFFTLLRKYVSHSVTIAGAGGYLTVPAILVVVLYSIYVILVIFALTFTAKGLWSFRRKKYADGVRPVEV